MRVIQNIKTIKAQNYAVIFSSLFRAKLRRTKQSCGCDATLAQIKLITVSFHSILISILDFSVECSLMKIISCTQNRKTFH